MPTAAKLVAALAFAATALFASLAIVAALPEGTVIGYFHYVNAALGAFAGWAVMGRLAGRGYGIAAASGVRTVVVFVFYALLVQALYRMLERAVQTRYSDVMEALAGAVDYLGQDGMTLLTTPPALAILLVGGVLAGVVTEAAARRWN